MLTIRDNKDILGPSYIPNIPLFQGGGSSYCLGFRGFIENGTLGLRI